MSDLMLLGVLRAPTPEPDNILGIAQLADRARQAADEIERLSAELERREHLTINMDLEHRAEIERLQARVEALEGDRQTLVLMGAQSVSYNVIKILNDWVKNDYAATEQGGET